MPLHGSFSKAAATLLVAATLSAPQPSHAAAPPDRTTTSGCIVRMTYAAIDGYAWSGECRNGRAHGPGELEFRTRNKDVATGKLVTLHYVMAGTFVDGAPDGDVEVDIDGKPFSRMRFAAGRLGGLTKIYDVGDPPAATRAARAGGAGRAAGAARAAQVETPAAAARRPAASGSAAIPPDVDPGLLRNPHECLDVGLAPARGGWGTGRPADIIRIENTCAFRIQYVGCLEAQSRTSDASYSCSNTPARVEDPNMGDLMVASLGPGEYQQVYMSDGTSPNLFSSGSFAVCRVQEPGAPYVIRMYRVRRSASGEWTALCGFESTLTSRAGSPTSGEIERSPWETRAPSRNAKREALLSCPDLERWYATLRVHETPDHPVGDWDECRDPGEEGTASFLCIKRMPSSLMDAKPTFDRLAEDVAACGRGIADVSKVHVFEVEEEPTNFHQGIGFQYGNQWQQVTMQLWLRERDDRVEIILKGVNGSKDWSPSRRPR